MSDVLQQRELILGDSIDVQAFMSNPRAYLEKLDEEGRLEELFPALARTKGVRQSPIRHAEGGVFVHTLMTLDAMIEQESPSEKQLGRLTDDRDLILVIFALMYHDTGKRERNLHDDPKGKRVDHVRESMNHARNDLANLLSSEDLEAVVEMIKRHEWLHSDNISHKINKLFKLFAFDGHLESGRALLKFTESDLLGRRVAEGHEHIWEENMKILDRNVELYQILLELDAEGVTFPVQRARNEITERIRALIPR